MKHLKVHDEKLATVRCPFCPKTFKFECYKNRHIKRVHNNSNDPEDKVEKNDEDQDKEVVLELNQMEATNGKDFSWQWNVWQCGNKSTKCSYKSFFNTLGLYSREDWDD